MDGIMADFFQATLDNVPQMHFLNTELLQFRVGIILVNNLQILGNQRIILVTAVDYVCNNHFRNLKCPWKLKKFIVTVDFKQFKILLFFPSELLFLSACLCCVR